MSSRTRPAVRCRACFLGLRHLPATVGVANREGLDSRLAVSAARGR
jgi:hypothetical protein